MTSRLTHSPARRSVHFHSGTADGVGKPDGLQPKVEPDRRYRMAFIAAVAVLLAPIVSTTFAPIVDYPNHLARAYIIRWYDVVPAFREEYALQLAPIPNVALDAVVSALMWVLPPLVAGRVFLASIVLLWAWGCHRLGAAIHGRATWLAVPCMLLAYHGGFQYGFVNYSLGLGVYLVGLAYWLRARHRWSGRRIFGAAALSCLAYLCHLSAYALFGASAVTVTLYDLARRRTKVWVAMLGGLPFVPPVVLLLAFLRGGGKAAAGEWNTLAGKAIAVFTVVRAYDVRTDVAIAALLLLATLTGLASLALAGRLRADGAALTGSVGLFTLFLACPKDLFTSGGADVRVVPAFVVLAVLALRIDAPPRLSAAALGLAMGALTLRMAEVTWAWHRLDADVARSVALLNTLPRGARLLPLYTGRIGIDRNKWDRALEHAPYYAVITRQAYVPLLFASAAQQPLVARRYGWGSISQHALLQRHLGEFDYVWSFGQPPAVEAALRLSCAPVGMAGDVTLWRVLSTPPAM